VSFTRLYFVPDDTVVDDLSDEVKRDNDMNDEALCDTDSEEESVVNPVILKQNQHP
jgi:hypothetical protein